jgi:hypothetical protein
MYLDVELMTSDLKFFLIFNRSHNLNGMLFRSNPHLVSSKAQIGSGIRSHSSSERRRSLFEILTLMYKC